MAGIPKKYSNVPYKPELKKEKYYNEVLRYCTDSSWVEDGTSILIYSDRKYGTGKTFNASYILKHYILNRAHLRDGGYFGNRRFCMFVSYQDFIFEAQTKYYDNSEDGDEFKRYLDDMLNTKLLVLDDIALEAPTQFSNNLTYLIINKRTAQDNLSTIVTSDKKINDMLLADRIRSRLAAFDKILIEGKDNRINKGAGG